MIGKTYADNGKHSETQSDPCFVTSDCYMADADIQYNTGNEDVL